MFIRQYHKGLLPLFPRRGSGLAARERFLIKVPVFCVSRDKGVRLGVTFTDLFVMAPWYAAMFTISLERWHSVVKWSHFLRGNFISVISTVNAFAQYQYMLKSSCDLIAACEDVLRFGATFAMLEVWQTIFDTLLDLAEARVLLWLLYELIYIMNLYIKIYLWLHRYGSYCGSISGEAIFVSWRIKNMRYMHSHWNILFFLTYQHLFHWGKTCLMLNPSEQPNEVR